MSGPEKAKKTRVLIVDADVDLRCSISDYLSLQDDIIAVGAAGDGMEALAAAKTSRPDVIVIDSMLPLLDGLGLVRHLRSEQSGETRDTACIFLISDGQDALLRETLVQGADFCMIKPVDLGELADRIRTAAKGGERDQSFYRKIAAQVLRRMQMRVNDDGFEYAERSIAILLENPDKRLRFKSVYTLVSEQASGLCMDGGKYVENDIRNAVKRTHAVNAPFYREVMGFGEQSQEACPTNGAFLLSVVQYIRIHHNLK